MQRSNFYDQVRSCAIRKVSVVPGEPARAVLLDPNPAYKQVAYDPRVKCTVECDQELIIKNQLERPRLIFLYLVAVLNTDKRGDIVGDNIDIQYLQLSESVNSNFQKVAKNNPGFTSIQINKIEKKAENKDMSYLEIIPATLPLNPGLLANIEQYRQNTELVEGLWSMVDRETSTPMDIYYKKLEEAYANGTIQQAPQIAAPAQQAAPQIAAPTYQAPAQPAYQAPAQPAYQAPAQQVYQAQPVQSAPVALGDDDKLPF